MESIPKENDFDKIMEDWEGALDRMNEESQGETSNQMTDVMNITATGSIEDVEKYLTDNFQTLSQAKRDFLLQSLRAKKFGIDLRNKRKK